MRTSRIRVARQAYIEEGFDGVRQVVHPWAAVEHDLIVAGAAVAPVAQVSAHSPRIVAQHDRQLIGSQGLVRAHLGVWPVPDVLVDLAKRAATMRALLGGSVIRVAASQRAQLRVDHEARRVAMIRCLCVCGRGKGWGHSCMNMADLCMAAGRRCLPLTGGQDERRIPNADQGARHSIANFASAWPASPTVVRARTPRRRMAFLSINHVHQHPRLSKRVCRMGRIEASVDERGPLHTWVRRGEQGWSRRRS